MDSVSSEDAALSIEDALRVDVRTTLPPDFVTQVLAAAPFVTVPGAFNVRDLSQPQTAADASTTPLMRRGFIYRSGMLTFIKDEGKTKLASDLGIKTIFDLRLAPEREKLPSPHVGDGVETVWLAPAQEPEPVNLADFAGADGGVEAHLCMYREILETHVPIYRTVLEHIRDHPDKPVLFHCAGGKDRTGILAALILQLVGYPNDVIARDYTLTRIGVEPAREFFFKELFSKKVAGNPIAEQGVVGLCSVQYETMIRFLEGLQEKYGGPDRYLADVLGFGEEERTQIRRNLKGASL